MLKNKVNIDSINEHNLIALNKFLDNSSRLNLIVSSNWICYLFMHSQALLKTFILVLDSENFEFISKNVMICNLPTLNVSANFQNSTKIEQMLKFISSFPSIETLELKNLKISNLNKDFIKILKKLRYLKSIKLDHCSIDDSSCEALPSTIKLSSLSLNRCNDSVFKFFRNLNSLKKISVKNVDWTWNGFDHIMFNRICSNCKDLEHISLLGAGTGSYFDCDEFPFKITSLETTMISFHWYVGIRSARVDFLKSQNGSLKYLTIHEFPYDFDGGKVLKYIIEEMNLETFYYGKIPLILNGKKQEVKEVEASEIQITSLYEMIKQFPSIEKITLKINNTDISSDAIESIINPPTNIFKNIKEFEVIDNSSYRGTFGVFLGLYKNLRNLQKLILKTQDRNINTILGCLPAMSYLEEIHLTSTAQRSMERYQNILKLAPNLKKIYVPSVSSEEALKLYKEFNIEVFDVDTLKRIKLVNDEFNKMIKSEKNEQPTTKVESNTTICFVTQTNPYDTKINICDNVISCWNYKNQMRFQIFTSFLIGIFLLTFLTYSVRQKYSHIVTPYSNKKLINDNKTKIIKLKKDQDYRNLPEILLYIQFKRAIIIRTQNTKLLRNKLDEFQPFSHSFKCTKIFWEKSNKHIFYCRKRNHL